VRPEGPTGAAAEFPDAVELRWTLGAGARFRSLGTGWEAVASLVTMVNLRARLGVGGSRGRGDARPASATAGA
jgi:hypothetical protein